MRANEPDNDLVVYAVRIAPAASAQTASERQRQITVFGADLAEAWRQGLLSSIASLATLPLRCQVAPEDPLYQEVYPGPSLRVLPYQRGRRGRGAVWRILFTAYPATANDPPMVRVEAILPGAQAPLTEWPREDENA